MITMVRVADTHPPLLQAFSVKVHVPAVKPCELTLPEYEVAAPQTCVVLKLPLMLML